MPSTSVSGTVTRRTAQPTKRMSAAERMTRSINNDNYNHDNYHQFLQNDSYSSSRIGSSTNNNNNSNNNSNNNNNNNNNSSNNNNNNNNTNNKNNPSLSVSVGGVAGLRALKGQRADLW